MIRGNKVDKVIIIENEKTNLYRIIPIRCVVELMQIDQTVVQIRTNSEIFINCNTLDSIKFKTTYENFLLSDTLSSITLTRA